MPMDDATAALLRLTLAGGAIAPRRQLLQNHDGDAQQAIRASHADCLAAGMDPAQILRLRGQDAPTEAIYARASAWLTHPDRHLLDCNDGEMATLLAATANPPLALFVAGQVDLLWYPQVAIVGSRSASAGGLDNAHAFARALADAGFAITSGLASGIDRAAHLGALRANNGKTLAVLGCGPDLAYPAENSELMQKIAETGLIVSEHAPGMPPLRQHFPARNRLVAGLSLGTLVIEAAERSGALITARLAAEAGREVFALPGSIHNPTSRGCHRLLRDGATLVVSPEQIIAELAPMLESMGQALRQQLAAPNSSRLDEATAIAPDHHGLWQALGHDPTPMDALLARTGLTLAQLSPMLLTLELEGRVSAEHGRYARKSPVTR